MWSTIRRNRAGNIACEGKGTARVLYISENINFMVDLIGIEPMTSSMP